MNSCRLEEKLTDDSCISTPEKANNYAGNYQLIRKIQIGGQASIFLSLKEQTYYALKIYNQGEIQDRAFQNQVDILSRLHHSGLVPVDQIARGINFKWEDEEEKPVHVIAMPFIENGDLFEWINQHGSFNEDAGRYFAKKLIGTFRYLASQHVCHRDIKPENILLNHHYEPLILDFGLSMDSRHKASNFVSDLRFSSPQVIKRSEYSQESEIYGLGILLFYILTGQYPFSYAKISDPNYRLLVERNYAHFWERIKLKVKKEFSPCFKQLFLNMVSHHPINRPNFDNLLEFSWFSGHQPVLQQYKKSMEHIRSQIPHKRIFTH